MKKLMKKFNESKSWHLIDYDTKILFDMLEYIISFVFYSLRIMMISILIKRYPKMIHLLEEKEADSNVFFARRQMEAVVNTSSVVVSLPRFNCCTLIATSHIFSLLISSEFYHSI